MVFVDGYNTDVLHRRKDEEYQAACATVAHLAGGTGLPAGPWCLVDRVAVVVVFAIAFGAVGAVAAVGTVGTVGAFGASAASAASLASVAAVGCGAVVHGLASEFVLPVSCVMVSGDGWSDPYTVSR